MMTVVCTAKVLVSSSGQKANKSQPNSDAMQHLMMFWILGLDVQEGRFKATFSWRIHYDGKWLHET